jgi:hypothetical protein
MNLTICLMAHLCARVDLRSDRSRYLNGQHDFAGARDYEIIDLSHIQRASQIWQVDGQAEHRRRDEITLACPQ